MPKILFVMMVGLAAAALASGATLCTSVPSGTNVLTGGFSCELGVFTFQNFLAQDAGGAGTPVITLTGASWDGVTARLTFNPNLFGQSAPADLYFWFEVVGPVFGVDLYNGGTGGTSIQEIVCNEPFTGQPPFKCEAPSIVLASMTAGDSQSADVPLLFADSHIYIWKDLLAGPNGHISAFEQSFHTPEPMSFVLMGAGLLGLGILARRRK